MTTNRFGRAGTAPALLFASLAALASAMAGPPPVSVPSGRAPLVAPGDDEAGRLATDPATDRAAWPLEAVVTWPAADAARWLTEDAQTDGLPGVPYRIGVVRDAPDGAVTSETRGHWSVLPDGSAVWTLRLVVPGALGVRVHFSGVELPAGAWLRVADAERSRVLGYAGRGPGESGAFWSGTVAGEVALLEYHDPGGGAAAGRFVVDGVLHVYRGAPPTVVLPQGGEPEGLLPCQQDVNCHPVDANARDAVGRMFFISGGGGFVCTGALLNDFDPATTRGWFVTANHCINTQSAASSLEVLWFYQTVTCNGGTSAGPTSYGATLLANSAQTDFSFLRLFQDPQSGQGLAGWTTFLPASPVHGIHHPGGSYKRYSKGNLTTQQPICGGLPLSSFWYLDWTLGMTEGGSSGSPLFNDDWQVVGQLFGVCYFNPPDCTNPQDNNIVYGRFDQSFPLVESWLLSGAPDDAYEQNDSIQQAAAIQTGTHALALFDANDYFAFTLCAPATLSVTATYAAGEVDLDLQLLTMGECVVAASAGPPGSQSITVALQPATYALRVFRSGGVGGAYSLNLSLTQGNGSGMGCDPGVRFVRIDAPGCGDGMSWATAYKQLRVALNAAAASGGAVNQLWVAKGTYKATGGTDRTASFNLQDGLALYGGFEGNETQVDERDVAANPTILSGDLLDDDGPNFANRTDNSLHVVRAIGVGATAVLDGFVIRAGNADGAGDPDDKGGGLWIVGASPTLRNCAVRNNRADYAGGGAANVDASPLFDRCVFVNNQSLFGGGTFNGGNGAPQFVNCIFAGNVASGNGGASDNNTADPSYVNCLFTGNSISGAGKGAGLYLFSGAAGALVNCTFAQNSAPGGSGGAVCVENSPAAVASCILHGNADAAGSGQSSQLRLLGGGTATVNYSCVQGWTGSLGGTGNIGADPLYVDPDGADNVTGTLDDDLRVSPGSPAIDAGQNSAVPPGVVADLDGFARFFDVCDAPDTGNGAPPIVDMGPYEAGAGPCPLPGDVNGDGVTDGADVPGFVDCLLTGCGPLAACGCGDVNGDTQLTSADVPAFVALLVAP